MKQERVTMSEGTCHECGQPLGISGVCYSCKIRIDGLPALQLILSQVQDEHVRQDAKWGGAEHDDQHIANDWNDFIQWHLRKAVPPIGVPSATYRQNMIAVAALAVAAVESFDRLWPAGYKVALTDDSGNVIGEQG
jgi:hypothetical protein